MHKNVASVRLLAALRVVTPCLTLVPYNDVVRNIDAVSPPPGARSQSGRGHEQLEGAGPRVPTEKNDGEEEESSCGPSYAVWIIGSKGRCPAYRQLQPVLVENPVVPMVTEELGVVMGDGRQFVRRRTSFDSEQSCHEIALT
jgi:hypothetical protein